MLKLKRNGASGWAILLLFTGSSWNNDKRGVADAFISPVHLPSLLAASCTGRSSINLPSSQNGDGGDANADDVQDKPVVDLALTANYPKIVAVAGATGRAGQLVVQELLDRNVDVVAVVRNMTKAKEVLPSSVMGNIVECDFCSEEDICAAVSGCDAAIWCATGFAEPPKQEPLVAKKISTLEKLKGLFGLASSPEPESEPDINDVPRQSIDDIGLPALAKAFLKETPEGQGESETQRAPPKVVMLSSAGVTRPSWTEEKKSRFEGAADIPIVRLNPFGILGIKMNSEETLRQSGVDYCIFRPAGLNDDWPAGSRPILSQGDVAVGRINRKDVATILCNVLFMKEATGKTFEAVTIEGYNSGGTTSGLSALDRFQLDKDGPLCEDAVATSYGIMQQLLPGEKQNAAALAMGQTYEQLDKDETGRFGKRGEEKVAGSMSAPTTE